MPRRVIHYTDSDGFGGAEQIMLTLLAGLDRTRWEPLLLHHGGAGVRPLVELVQEQGVRTRAVVAGGNALAQTARLVRVVREERPAIFHAHLNWPLAARDGIAAAIAARVPGVCATEHSFIDVPVRRSRVVQRLLSTGVDRYIAVSHDLARRLDRTFHFTAHKVQVIHNGIPLEPFDAPPDPATRERLAITADQPLLVSVARLHTQKGVQVLLDAAALLPDVVVVLVGEGPHRAQFEAQARALGIVHRVHFVGHQRNVVPTLQAADVFALPSMFEGLPLSVLEAMACGLPVVATAVGGIGEAVVDGETGLLVPPSDPPALASALDSLLSRPDRARAMGVAGQRRCRAQFGAPAMVERTSLLYDAILAGPRHARP